MTTEAQILTDEQIAQTLNDAGVTEYDDVPLRYDLEIARAIEQAVLQSPACAQWADARNGYPYGEGQYVVRINKHGHLRLGQRVLNSDTLRHQWQVDGEVCETVTHYLPIPALTIKEQP